MKTQLKLGTAEKCIFLAALSMLVLLCAVAVAALHPYEVAFFAPAPSAPGAQTLPAHTTAGGVLPVATEDVVEVEIAIADLAANAGLPAQQTFGEAVGPPLDLLAQIRPVDQNRLASAPHEGGATTRRWAR